MAGKDKKQNRLWVCVCKCGGKTTARADSLRARHVRSCGCIARSKGRASKSLHGKTKTPEWIAWLSMKQRCLNSTHKAFRYYGGRGISICRRWLGAFGFIRFLADMGKRPSVKHSLDRYPDNDGNYEPRNVRWATKKQQANNRRKRRPIH